jgi:hypothetical protein
MRVNGVHQHDFCQADCWLMQAYGLIEILTGIVVVVRSRRS